MAEAKRSRISRLRRIANAEGRSVEVIKRRALATYEYLHDNFYGQNVTIVDEGGKRYKLKID